MVYDVYRNPLSYNEEELYDTERVFCDDELLAAGYEYAGPLKGTQFNKNYVLMKRGSDIKIYEALGNSFTRYVGEYNKTVEDSNG